MYDRAFSDFSVDIDTSSPPPKTSNDYIDVADKVFPVRSGSLDPSTNHVKFADVLHTFGNNPVSSASPDKNGNYTDVLLSTYQPDLKHVAQGNTERESDVYIDIIDDDTADTATVDDGEYDTLEETCKNAPKTISKMDVSVSPYDDKMDEYDEPIPALNADHVAPYSTHQPITGKQQHHMTGKKAKEPISERSANHMMPTKKSQPIKSKRKNHTYYNAREEDETYYNVMAEVSGDGRVFYIEQSHPGDLVMVDNDMYESGLAEDDELVMVDNDFYQSGTETDGGLQMVDNDLYNLTT